MLAGCEMSGRVRDAFAARNWEAWSADILPSEIPPQRGYTAGESRYLSLPGARGCHYQGDCRDLFDWYHPVNAERRRQELTMREAPPLWNLFIGFPPCTDLSLAGARWWKAKREPRYDENFEEIWSVQDEAAAFFMRMIDAPAAHVAVENPRGDMNRRYRPPDQTVQPFYFGDPVAKQTGLWLEGLPLLLADNPVDPGANRVATGGGSWKNDIKNGRKSVSTEDSEGRARRDIVRSRTSLEVARAMADQWGSYIEEEHGNQGR
jgi:hypothetical protein